MNPEIKKFVEEKRKVHEAWLTSLIKNQHDHYYDVPLNEVRELIEGLGTALDYLEKQEVGKC